MSRNRAENPAPNDPPVLPEPSELTEAEQEIQRKEQAEALRKDDAERHANDPEYHAHMLTADEIAYLRKNVLI